MTAIGAAVSLLLCTTQDKPANDGKPEEPGWAFSAAVYAFWVPEERNYVQPTVTADRDWLHLEARYNYEAHGTASAWIGANFTFGDTLKLEVTPMAAGVFGRTMGIAPGFRATLGFWKLELSSESEVVFDFHDHFNSFLYTWSELTVAPVDALRLGVVVQRTKVYETAFDIQRGFLVRFLWDPVELTGYVLNPGHDPVVVASIAVNF